MTKQDYLECSYEIDSTKQNKRFFYKNIVFQGIFTMI